VAASTPTSNSAGTAAPRPDFPQVYDELRRLAHRRLRDEADGHSLNTTALVHEAYLRLAEGDARWGDRKHFFALAATAMRRILVDHARRLHAVKRGDGARRLNLDDVAGLAVEARADVLVALDEALDRLASLEPRQARVVECRWFAGLSEEETAQALGIGLRTVKRDWAMARGWLYQELRPDEGRHGQP
jgi:RNA polymerase sigma factor (TIGR02999 family)